MLVERILKQGKENALNLTTLANYYKCSRVDIIQQVFMEQENGAPICVNRSGRPGYYLAKNKSEYEEYLQSVRKRY